MDSRRHRHLAGRFSLFLGVRVGPETVGWRERERERERPQWVGSHRQRRFQELSLSISLPTAIETRRRIRGTGNGQQSAITHDFKIRKMNGRGRRRGRGKGMKVTERFECTSCAARLTISWAAAPVGLDVDDDLTLWERAASRNRDGVAQFWENGPAPLRLADFPTGHFVWFIFKIASTTDSEVNQTRSADANGTFSASLIYQRVRIGSERELFIHTLLGRFIDWPLGALLSLHAPQLSKWSPTSTLVNWVLLIRGSGMEPGAINHTIWLDLPPTGYL